MTSNPEAVIPASLKLLIMCKDTEFRWLLFMEEWLVWLAFMDTAQSQAKNMWKARWIEIALIIDAETAVDVVKSALSIFSNYSEISW